MDAMLIGLIGVYLALVIIVMAAQWKIYEKARQPGWAVLVPFYNTYVLIVNILQMRPVWFWLTLVPCVNIVVAIILVFMIPFKLAEKFGKDAGFAIGLLLLGIIFYPILGFGTAQYVEGRGRSRDNDYDEEEEDDDRPRRRSRDRDDDRW